MHPIHAIAVFALALGPVHLIAEDHAGHDHGKAEAHQANEKPPHGGILKEVGNAHLELVHSATSGALTLYVLDGKLQPHPIIAKPLTVQAKPTGATALIQVTLAPATGDKASEFSGTSDALKGVASVEVIVRIELDGKNQRLVFSTGQVPDSHSEGDGHKH